MDNITQVLHFQHWLKNQARASQVNCKQVAIVIEWAAAATCGGSEKVMGRCTAQLKILLFRAKTIVTD